MLVIFAWFLGDYPNVKDLFPEQLQYRARYANIGGEVGLPDLAQR
jgi:hypothetical protein